MPRLPNSPRTPLIRSAASAVAARSRPDDAVVERLARTFRALGVPARSRLVLALSREELCVTELADLVGLSLSATSHQLRVLRDLDIVRVRRAGKNQMYVLNETAFGFCAPRACQAWRPLLAIHEPRRGRRACSRP